MYIVVKDASYKSCMNEKKSTVNVYVAVERDTSSLSWHTHYRSISVLTDSLSMEHTEVGSLSCSTIMTIFVSSDL